MKMYKIFDVCKPILADDYICMAKNGAEACKKYLAQENIPFAVLSRSGSNNVRLQVMAVNYDSYNKLCQAGNAVWYKVS